MAINCIFLYITWYLHVSCFYPCIYFKLNNFLHGVLKYFSCNAVNIYLTVPKVTVIFFMSLSMSLSTSQICEQSYQVETYQKKQAVISLICPSLMWGRQTACSCGQNTNSRIVFHWYKSWSEITSVQTTWQ